MHIKYLKFRLLFEDGNQIVKNIIELPNSYRNRHLIDRKDDFYGINVKNNLYCCFLNWNLNKGIYLKIDDCPFDYINNFTLCRENISFYDGNNYSFNEFSKIVSCRDFDMVIEWDKWGYKLLRKDIEGKFLDLKIDRLS